MSLPLARFQSVRCTHKYIARVTIIMRAIVAALAFIWHLLHFKLGSDGLPLSVTILIA